MTGQWMKALLKCVGIATSLHQSDIKKLYGKGGSSTKMSKSREEESPNGTQNIHFLESTDRHMFSAQSAPIYTLLGGKSRSLANAAVSETNAKFLCIHHKTWQQSLNLLTFHDYFQKFKSDRHSGGESRADSPYRGKKDEATKPGGKRQNPEKTLAG